MFVCLGFFFNITARTVTSFRMDTEAAANEEMLDILEEGVCRAKMGGFYPVLSVRQEHDRDPAMQIVVPGDCLFAHW